MRVFDGAGLISELDDGGQCDYLCNRRRGRHLVLVVSARSMTTVVEAINGTSAGRSGKGSVLVCSAGNKGRSTVDFPARHRRAIAVGACGPNTR